VQKSRWQHHPKYGYVYGSETVHGGSTDGGKVQSCWYWPANKRGNMGLIRGDYGTADLKVLVFGDSFTAQVDTGFDPKGVTWPDFLQDYLIEATSKSVHVVNFGRDGTGLLHMVDLARDMVPKWKPDLVIFSFITDDFTRDRFFRTPIVIDGRERVITNNDPERPADNGSDTAVVHSKASKEWCEREQAKSGASDDPVLLAMEQTVRDARAHASGKPTVTSRDRSFLFDRVYYDTPFYTTYAKAKPTRNPRHPMANYQQDERFMDGVAAVRKFGVPVALTHLVHYEELKAGHKMGGTNQDRSLALSLEKAFGVPILYTADYGSIAKENLAKIKRSPVDAHPTVFGMRYYANAVFKALLANRFIARSTKGAP
jgi:hypothetical protein